MLKGIFLVIYARVDNSFAVWDPVRIPGTKRLMPSLLYPYGTVPFVYAASSMQHIISLTYLILWTWEEHKIACKETQKTPHKDMIILIDEIEKVPGITSGWLPGR